MAHERIQKIIATSGMCSRRKAELLIRAGRVQLNGAPAKIGQSADAASDDIRVDGEKIAAAKKKYFLLNKPRGVESTLRSVGGRKAVVSFVQSPIRVVPVGRLDMNSRGLLLLTNDGELALRVAHPRYSPGKVYEVLVQGDVPPEILVLLSKGVRLDDGITAPCEVSYLKRGKATLLRMVLHQGKKRQIRRMVKKVGFNVLDLVRTHIGPLSLSGLAEGASRELSATELSSLKKALKMK